MSTSQQALDEYTSVMRERRAYISKNQGVFDTHEQIVLRVIDAENRLRDAVAEEKAEVENDEFKVVIKPNTPSVNIDALRTQEGATLTKELIDKLIEMSNTRPPQVSIRPKV